MKKTTGEKINNVDEQMRILAEEKKALQKKKREEEQDERNKRYCKRGGIAEKQIPELAKMTDEQFDFFAEKVLFTEYAKRVIADILNPQPTPAPSVNPPKDEDDSDTEPLTSEEDES